ncbi:MAG: NAD(P)-dependent oxidoreductase [Nitrospinae bacterium]|nr:NAD(P)-dependent oxidoreductase [Nitrospinota bacterium]
MAALEESELKNKKICITGASGFIGKNLVNKLIGKCDNIAVVTRKNTGQIPNGVEVFEFDLSEPSVNLDRFVDDCDIIFHCSAETKIEEKMQSTNVNGIKNLISSVLKSQKHRTKPLHWVQLSSCGAYGPPLNVDSERIVTEVTATNPVNEYEKTKTEADNILIKSFMAKKNISFSILRPSNVIGEGMKKGGLHKMASLIKKRTFFYAGKRGATATYVHLDDVTRALIVLATDAQAKDEIFNLSSDCKLEEIVQIIAENNGMKSPSIYLPLKVVQLPVLLFNKIFGRFLSIPKVDLLALRTRYSSEKIEKILGFHFSKPMPNGISDIKLD